MRRVRIIGAAIAVLAFAVPVAAAAPRSPLPGWLEQMIGEAPPAMQQMMGDAGTMNPGGSMRGMMGGR